MTISEKTMQSNLQAILELIHDIAKHNAQPLGDYGVEAQLAVVLNSGVTLKELQQAHAYFYQLHSKAPDNIAQLVAIIKGYDSDILEHTVNIAFNRLVNHLDLEGFFIFPDRAMKYSFLSAFETYQNFYEYALKIDRLPFLQRTFKAEYQLALKNPAMIQGFETLYIYEANSKKPTLDKMIYLGEGSGEQEKQDALKHIEAVHSKLEQRRQQLELAFRSQQEIALFGRELTEQERLEPVEMAEQAVKDLVAKAV